MRQDPLVSVVMGSFEPCWSRLRRAVDSLVGQTLPEWELLLWDDGSSPQGALALEQAARLDPRVRLVHAGENRGLAHGLNQCVEKGPRPLHRPSGRRRPVFSTAAAAAGGFFVGTPRLPVGGVGGAAAG